MVQNHDRIWFSYKQGVGTGTLVANISENFSPLVTSKVCSDHWSKKHTYTHTDTHTHTHSGQTVHTLSVHHQV